MILRVIPYRDVPLLLRSLALSVATCVVVGLLLLNLEAYPRTWFDEGQYLHVAKALITHGVYADWSSEGPRYYGPTVATGPTVLLPVAASFKVAGVGLTQARAPLVLYLAAALLLCYVVGARIYGQRAGVLAAALLLASRGVDTLVLGRQVAGEVPALMFVLLGLLFWHAALVRGCGRRALGAGLCWGLAMVTKNQVVVALTPALALVALLDWRFYRNGRWSLRWLPLALALALAATWLVVLFGILGPSSLGENIALTRKAAGGAIVVLSPEAISRALLFLFSPRLYGGLLVPALVYGAWRVWRRRDLSAQSESTVLLCVAVWMLWYVCSLGWPRYAAIGAALGALPVAAMLVALHDWSVRNHRRWAMPGLVAALVVLVAIPLVQTAKDMLMPDRSVLRFAAYLDRTIEPQTVIETWEPELGGLTDHRYHYPPQALLDVAVRHRWMGSPPATYDLEHSAAPYVVIGPFGAWTGVYPPDQIDRRYEPVFADGPYTLYRRRP